MTERTVYQFDEEEWRKDCLYWRGRVLTGRERHWCYDWDELPIDETTPEWPCSCGVKS